MLLILSIAGILAMQMNTALYRSPASYPVFRKMHRRPWRHQNIQAHSRDSKKMIELNNPYIHQFKEHLSRKEVSQHEYIQFLLHMFEYSPMENSLLTPELIADVFEYGRIFKILPASLEFGGIPYIPSSCKNWIIELFQVKDEDRYVELLNQLSQVYPSFQGIYEMDYLIRHTLQSKLIESSNRALLIHKVSQKLYLQVFPILSDWINVPDSILCTDEIRQLLSDLFEYRIAICRKSGTLYWCFHKKLIPFFHELDTRQVLEANLQEFIYDI